ncbi:MAG: hypothetical protein AB1567_04480 [bacterium]
MKKIITMGLLAGIVLVPTMAMASSNPNTPVAVRQVNPSGTWTGTASNPEYITFSGEKTDTLDIVSEVTSLKGGTLTGITNPIAIDTDSNDQMTVVQPTGSNLHMVVDSGVITTVGNLTIGTINSILQDVGIKDNGNSITIDTTQLPGDLDSTGGLKVHEVGTANVKLDSNIDTALGKVKVTDGTDILAIGSDGSIDVNTTQADQITTYMAAGTLTGSIPAGDNTIGRMKITDGTDVVGVTSDGKLQVTTAADGTPVSGYYEVSIPANSTVNDIGSYTVTAGKTLHLESICMVFKGDALCNLKVNEANKSALATEASNSMANRYLGENYTISAGAVLSAAVTNNEAVAITVYFSWHGIER